MESVRSITNGDLSTATVARQTQECLNELKNLALENPKSPPNVLLNIGRPGTGKSAHVEDTSGLRGYSQQSLDPVTQKCQLAKVRIENKTCFIMDTPGFDPENAEAVFLEIVRGIQTVLSISRIAGFLYFTCINQPRFDSFDSKVLQVVRAMSGDDYIPCVTFITTFWSADGHLQQSILNTQLGFLKRICRQVFQSQELHFYQHGRGYNADGEVTESFINWFDDSGRNLMAQHARDMIAKRFYGPSASAVQEITPRIVQELRRGTRIHETDAARVLGLQPPLYCTGPLEENEDTSSEDIPQAPRDGPEAVQAPGRTLGETVLDGISWFFRNVKFDVNVGGPGGGMASSVGSRSGGMRFGDPLSSVDVMKSVGLDSSREGRSQYAAQHGIGGRPFSAAWGDAIRQDVIRRYRQ